MEGREPMQSSYAGTPPYYVQQGGFSVAMSGPQSGVLPDPAPGFGHLSNEGYQQLQSGGLGSGFQIDNLNSNYQQQNPHIGSSSRAVLGNVVKKKRGRPRKYDPDMSAAITPISERVSQGSVAASGKQKRGRPPGTGRKQILASMGGWMNRSAGSAFAPHVLNLKPGEDIASEIIQISLQRPRALCITSGTGTISSVTLRQPSSSDNLFTYKGHFEILHFSGSYLVSEEDGSKRTGGLNITLGHNGHIVGGVIGGPLIADSPVQVVAFSFIYDTSKGKMENDEPPRHLEFDPEEGEPSNTKPINNPGQITGGNTQPSSQQLDSRDPGTGIDLMLG